MKSKLSVCWVHHVLLFILTTHFLSSILFYPWTKSVLHQSKKSKYKGCGQDSGGPELVRKSNNRFHPPYCISSFIFRTSEVPIPSSPGVKIPIPVRSSSPDDFEVNTLTYNTCNDVGLCEHNVYIVSSYYLLLLPSPRG